MEKKNVKFQYKNTKTSIIYVRTEKKKKKDKRISNRGFESRSRSRAYQTYTSHNEGL
jgi:hypothetical protein